MQLEAYETPSPPSTERETGDAYDNKVADGITECLRGYVRHAWRTLAGMAD
jgi:hypothetical protein